MLKQLIILVAVSILGSPAQARDSVILTFKSDDVVFSREAHSSFEKSRMAKSALKKLINKGLCDPDSSGLEYKQLDQMFACVVKNKPNNFIVFSRHNGDTSFMQMLREDQPADAYFVELLTPEFMKKIEELTIYNKRNGGGNRVPRGPKANHQPPYVTRPWYRIKLIGDSHPAVFRIIDAEIRQLQFDLKDLHEELNEIDEEIKHLVDTQRAG